MYKNIKRTLAIFLAIALAAGFTGCKKNPDPADSELSIEYIYEYDDDNTASGDTSNDGNSNENTNSASNGNSGASSTANSASNGKSGASSTSGKVNNNNTSRIKDLKGREIVYVAWWDGIDRTSTDGKILSEVEKQLNCKLVERNMSNYQALYTSILSGNPIADIFVPKTTGDVINLANKGMLTPLNSLSNFDFSDEKWNQGCVAETTLNGNVYGMTRKMQVRDLLIYNKTMFEKNNWEDLYTLQKNGKLTWSKLYEIMQKAAVVNNNTVTRYALAPSYNIEGLATIMLNANGVKAISRTGDSKNLKYNLNSNAGLNALNEFKKWTSLAGGVYDNTAAGWDTNREVFYTGKSAMIIESLQESVNIAAKSDFEIGMVLFPHGPDTNQNLVSLSIMAEAIPAGVKNPDDVALFWDIFRDALTDESKINTYKDVLTDESVSPTIDRYINEFNSGKYIFDYASLMDGFDEEYRKIAFGQTTPAASISSLQNSVQGYIDDFWK